MIQATVELIEQLMKNSVLNRAAKAKAVPVKPIRIDLNRFCCYLLRQLQLSSGDNYQLQLVSRCSDPTVYLDAKLLHQILDNLLANAIRCSPQGGTIQLKVMRQNDEVIFQVQDESVSILPQASSYQFKSVRRANSMDTIAGTRLGLAIVQHCVDALAGQLSITSQENEGTTFQVVLPLALSPIPLPPPLLPTQG